MDTIQFFQRFPQNLQGEASKTSEALPLQGAIPGGADSAARLFLNFGEQKLGLSLILSQVLHTRSTPGKPRPPRLVCLDLKTGKTQFVGPGMFNFLGFGEQLGIVLSGNGPE